MWPITSCKNRCEILANLSTTIPTVKFCKFQCFSSHHVFCLQKRVPPAEADLLLVTLSISGTRHAILHLVQWFFWSGLYSAVSNRIVTAFHLRLIKCLTSSANMLFWSFCLLTFFQCVSGLVISTLCKDFIQDSSKPIELRPLVLEIFTFVDNIHIILYMFMFAAFLLWFFVLGSSDCLESK